ncbi:peptide ABC transporter permease [Rhodanobacter sp. B04]|uniref:ABC transporter permease n=1 Tax=Rhodanobacter sp. B04 TaxID=1945860 RepID=UPI0009854EBE|nr:ABC transporter permease [Rhodanobacter sp. B04]OOG64031.1 peptide ABC transporter permease [Rhodanobacter sp. B04]
MMAYYLGLALRSSRRSRALTALVIVLMGCGVATCMVSYAVFRATAADPIPWKSNQLFVAQVDNFGPTKTYQGEPPDLLSYTDATALLAASKAVRQALVYPVSLSIVPGDSQRQPFSLPGDAVTSDFFAMFDVPFRYGSHWSAADDAHRAAVVVISDALNRQLFGGADSVGRVINLDAHDYRIAGVLDDWNPRPRFFDLASSAGGAFGAPGQIYIPFGHAIDLQKSSSGASYCSSTDDSSSHGPGWSAFLRGECVWISAWVELPTAADTRRYRQYLGNYAAEQQRVGRFAWAPNVRLRSVMQWLDVEHVVPKASKLSMIVSMGFLLICLVNVMGLLLAGFMRRALEVGVRRALGASRGAIHRQFLVEAAALGLAGGVLGLLLTLLGLSGIRLVFEAKIAGLVRLDPALVLLTVLVAVITTLIAALYPVWRAAQVQPAWQLKSSG